MDKPDEVAGVFEAIDAEGTAHDQIDHNEVSDAAKAEGAETEDQGDKTEQKQTTKKDESEQTETGTTDEGTTQQTETKDSQTETKTEDAETSESAETNTDETSKPEAEYKDWQKQLPPPPPDYSGKKPEFNDEGQITNMTPQEYVDYVKGEAVTANRKDNYDTFVEGRALDIAEQILPDIKTNPAIRQLVENTRISGILQGKTVDTVQAALAVRDALGLSSDKLEAAKAEGAQNARVNITESKNAALETGSTQTKSSKKDPTAELQKRIAMGDDNAFAQLLGAWEDQGKI